MKKPSKNIMICKLCKNQVIPRYAGGIIISRLCWKCQTQKKRQLKKEIKEKKLMMCLRCHSRKRENKPKSTLCRTCRLESSVTYWGKKVWTKFVQKLKTDEPKIGEYAACYTCQIMFPIKELQGGHCFHRGRGGWRAIDFDPRHIHLQCAGCNINGGGKIPIFTAKIIQNYGMDYYKELERGSVAPALSVEELKKLYENLPPLR